MNLLTQPTPNIICQCKRIICQSKKKHTVQISAITFVLLNRNKQSSTGFQCALNSKVEHAVFFCIKTNHFSKFYISLVHLPNYVLASILGWFQVPVSKQSDRIIQSHLLICKNVTFIVKQSWLTSWCSCRSSRTVTVEHELPNVVHLAKRKQEALKIICLKYALTIYNHKHIKCVT